MSLHNGTAAETERKRMLEAEGHIILNLGQNQYGDLEDICCDVIIEVKTSKHPRRDLSHGEKNQLRNLLLLRKYRTIRYDVRFAGSGRRKPSWVMFFPTDTVSSFGLPKDSDLPSRGIMARVSVTREVEEPSKPL